MVVAATPLTSCGVSPTPGALVPQASPQPGPPKPSSEPAIPPFRPPPLTRPTPTLPIELPDDGPKPLRSDLAIGSAGPQVKRLQRALIALTYDPGSVDGRFGYETQHGVLAFEKVEGLGLDATVTPREMRRLLTAEVPRAPQREVEDFVDVDIGRQILFEVHGGRVTHTLPVSTGSGGYYESMSGTAVAHTPRGTFTIYSKISGWRVGYLGAMYYPSYFNGGYAIHGSASVPPYPASHGCVRIPMHSTIGFFERNPAGTIVFVHD